jgi:transcription elongation factor Elf1
MHETIVDMDNNRRYVKVYHCPFCKEFKFEELVCPSCHYEGAIMWNPYNSKIAGAKIVQCHNCGQIVSFKIKNGHFGVFAEKCPKPKIKVLLV